MPSMETPKEDYPKGESGPCEFQDDILPSSRGWGVG